MTKDLITVFPDSPFARIKEIFETHDFHHIPVINRDERVVGIISREDWLRSLKRVAEQTAGRTYTEKFYQGMVASELMSENPLVLDPDDNVGLAADIFMANKFHAIPIVEDDQIQGILTTHDLIGFAFQSNTVMKE